jgi:hypothetical protein
MPSTTATSEAPRIQSEHCPNHPPAFKIQTLTLRWECECQAVESVFFEYRLALAWPPTEKKGRFVDQVYDTT